MQLFLLKKSLGTIRAFDFGASNDSEAFETGRNFWRNEKIDVIFVDGKMAEWSIAAVLKTVELQGSGGSNPSPSADNLSY